MRLEIAAALALVACHHTAPTVVETEAPTDVDPEDPNDAAPTVVALPPSPSPRAALVGEAHRELGAMHETHYAHHTHIVEASGEYDYDCSGFVGYALARVAPDALQALVKASRPRPLAKDFEAFFTAPTAPWTRVDHAADLVTGDVIAWLEPAVKHSKNTGHVMIVEHAPMPGERPGELVVDVVDSSHSGHGLADPRTREHRSGLGTGSLILIVDAQGRPTGYRWSQWAKSVPYTTDVALGHLP